LTKCADKGGFPALVRVGGQRVVAPGTFEAWLTERIGAALAFGTIEAEQASNLIQTCEGEPIEFDTDLCDEMRAGFGELELTTRTPTIRTRQATKGQSLRRRSRRYSPRSRITIGRTRFSSLPARSRRSSGKSCPTMPNVPVAQASLVGLLRGQGEPDQVTASAS
jgi:hypothetical protein